MRSALLAGALFGQVGAETTDRDWTHYGADPASTKFADVSQIDSTNFDSLRIIWRWTVPDSVLLDSLGLESDRYRNTPIVVDGVLYTLSPLHQLCALDAATGAPLWTYDPESWRVESEFSGFGRGLSYWSDGDQSRIIFGTASAYLHSVDARSGRPDPDFGVDGRIDLTQGLGRPVDRGSYAQVSAPAIWGDIIIAGSSAMDWRLGRDLPPILPPGDVRGFDVRTGELLWVFHSPPRDGEFGADTWEPGAWSTQGGANVWSSMTVDEELGYVYLPFGTPSGDFYGGERPGDNLFGESLVCLDARTGQRVWHFQFIHHGLWDYDIPAAPVLVDIVVDGRPIQAVAQVTKQAFCYVFDRLTGEPVWPIVERAVPPSTAPGEHSSPTQPFPTRPAAFDRQGLSEDDLIDFTPELRAAAVEMMGQFVTGPLYTPPVVDKMMILVPGTLGGADWVGAAVDPQSGILFVPSKTRPRRLRLSEPRASRAVGHYRYLGWAPSFHGPEGLPITKPPYGRITAIDLNTGEHRWVTPTGRGPKDHPAIRHLDLPEDLGWNVRNFLVATPTLLLATSERPDGGGDYWKRPERYLKAYDPESGRLLGKTPLPDYSYGGLIAYAAGGRQFVVTPVGRGRQAQLMALAVPTTRDVLPPQMVQRTDAEHPRFYEAVALIDSGDVVGLRQLLDEEPELISARGFTHPMYGDGYFRGARLFHLLANNPTRQARVPNTMALVELLIEAGAQLDAQSDEGNTLLSLVVTSGQLRRHDLKTPMILRLLEAGADPDVPDGRVLDNTFTNYNDSVAVATFVSVGFSRDIRFAAALGEIDTLRSYFDVDGRLVDAALPRDRRQVPDSLEAHQYALDLALCYAAYWNQLEAARFLLERGAEVNSQPPGFYWRDDRGSPPLHKSGDAGRMEMVKLLLANGADPTAEATQWGGTAADWSRYGGHTEVREVLLQAERDWSASQPETE